MNPKAKDVLNIVQAFKDVLPMATMSNHLNMNRTNVCGGNYECGSIHCHGGWYAVEMINKGRLSEDSYISFTEGADMMAEDLGFKNRDELATWASKNAKIWGNIYGLGMFCCEDAFQSNDRPQGAQNLQHIIDHWTEVYERLVILEKEETREDITSKLAKLPVEEKLDVVEKLVEA